MLPTGPIVISVPARELADIDVPGSVFDISFLRASDISRELRVALDLIGEFDAARGVSHGARCIARPEMFTHGPSLAWLRKQIEGVTDHVCLSDGTALKLIPDLRNHLFTYGLQSHRRFLDFKKLTRRAPELLGQFQTQINSFHRVALDGLAFEPSPWMLNRRDAALTEPVWFYEMYLNPNSLEDSAELMLEWGTLESPSLGKFKKVQYVPLTECAIQDEQFQQLLGDIIAEVFFEPSACLLMRLPSSETDLTERMRSALAGILGARRHIPQTRANNIFFVSGDIADDILTETGDRLNWSMHHSFDHWRHSRTVYEASEEISVFLERQWTRVPDTARTLLTSTFGRPPRFLLPARSLDVDGFPE